MRLLLGSFSICLLATPACLDGGGKKASERPASTVRLRVADLTLPDGFGCYAFRASTSDADPASEPWLSIGTLAAKTSRSEALAAGDECEMPETTGPAEVVRDCEANTTNIVNLVVTSLSKSDGSGLVPGDDYENPCTAAIPCNLEFECAAGVETLVEFNLSIMRSPNQGFFDISVNGMWGEDFGMSPHRFTACYAMRVDSGVPTDPMVWGETEICADQYGDNQATVTYIGTCNAEAPDHTVTLWLQDLEFDPSVPEAERNYVNPCPVPDDSSGDISTWPGGCTLQATCRENDDVVVEFNLQLAPGE